MADGSSSNASPVVEIRKLWTVFKSPDGPKDTDGWMIRSFHSSADAFDNPIITFVAQGVFWRAGIGGAVVGTVLGLIIGIFASRRKASTT